jgi:hypothetical protein
MISADILIPCSVMALLRGDVSAGYIADRFGVTEAQVLEWKDVFLVAGTMAVAGMQRAQGSSGPSQGGPSQGGKPPIQQQGQPKPKGGIGDPTTKPPGSGGIGDPTTTPAPFDAKPAS